MSFLIRALPAQQFAQLFDLDETELRSINARREVVTEHPGYPCRVSLADALVGETVLLMNYEHQPGPSPFRAAHAIFVRQDVEQVQLEPNVVPGALSSRLLSVRGFDDEHLMCDADVAEGDEVGDVIERLLADERIAYIHLHYARPGCFAAHVSRI